MSRYSSRYVAALALLLLAQAGLTYGLREHIFFNDDHEQLARAFAFDELYLTQFSVHMPVPAVISKLYLGVVGFTHLANRTLAACVNVVIILSVFRLATTFALERHRRWAGFIAAVAWLALENDAWGFLNIAQLHSAAFLFLGLALAFDRTGPQDIELRRPFGLGVCLALTCMSRIMVIEQIAIIALGTLLLGFRPQVGWPAYLVRMVGGGVLAAAFVAAVFSDRLKALLYWTLQHNLRAKSGTGFNLSGWIGHLDDAFVRDMNVRLAVILLLSVTALVVHRARDDKALTKKAMIWLIAFAGGWVASNPSGISTIYTNAIPAFPALAVLLAVASTTLPGRWTAATLFGGGLAIANIGAFQRLLQHVHSADARPHLERTRDTARYMREHSNPADRIFVFGTNPLLYPEAQRGSATMASILYSELALYQDDILEQLEADRPKFVVFDRRDYWLRVNTQIFPKIVGFVRTNYEPTENASVLVRRERPDSSGDGATTFIDEALGWHRSCSGGRIRIASQDPPTRLAFDHPSKWSELALSSNFDSDEDYVFTITSSNAFGHMFDASDKRLRVLTRDSAGKLRWYWFGGKDLVNDSTAEIAYRSLAEGDPIQPDATITAIQVGGWGDASQPVSLDKVALTTSRPSACSERAPD